MVSLDINDAHLQVPVHLDSHKFLRFVAFGTTYRFRALCYGLSMAPQVFTRVMALVFNVSSPVRHQDLQIPRRLSSSGPVEGAGLQTVRDYSSTMSRSGNHYQQGQVKSGSFPESFIWVRLSIL